jgi:hypothetical protein
LEAEVLVWAGICHDGRTQLKIVQGTLNAIKYRDDILNNIVLPFLHQRSFDYVFQHDHARCHVASVCQYFLNQNHIRVLPWSALSSDLSPIEHLWDEVQKKRYQGLMLNIFYIENKKIDKNRIIQIHMGITNKAVSTKFLNIIIRRNHGQTDIVMQY